MEAKWSLVTLINEKFVMFSMFPLKEALSSWDKADFYQILSTVHYDNQLTVEQVMGNAAEKRIVLQKKSSVRKRKNRPDDFNGGKQWRLVIVIVIVIFLTRKKKPTIYADGGHSLQSDSSEAMNGQEQCLLLQMPIVPRAGRRL